MLNHPFYEFLSQRLERPLPGRDAQMKMAPVPRSEGAEILMNPPGNAKKSAVLILLEAITETDLNVVLTLRTQSIIHAGQISFPGGRIEPDETPVQAALREMEEEIGISQSTVSTIGSLTDLYLSRSNNIITPFIGFTGMIKELKPNPFEVDEAFLVPVDKLINHKNLIRENWTLRDMTFEVPYWNIHKVPLWGATAMIMSEFLELYREFREE